MTDKAAIFDHCPRCGTYRGPRSCNACLLAWNGDGSWLAWYWRTYFGQAPRKPQDGRAALRAPRQQKGR